MSMVSSNRIISHMRNIKIGYGISNIALPIFRQDNPDRAQNYVFRHRIETDGHSISITLISSRFKHLVLLPKSRTRGATKKADIYVDRLSQAQCLPLRNKVMYGLDPNVRDQLYVVDTHWPGGNSFRYTSQQRQFESKRKERKKWREKKGRTTKIPTIQGGHESIFQLQSRYMENLNAKSHDPEVFRSVIQCKTRVFKLLSRYYSDMMFRKDRLRAYAGLQATEASLIKCFKAKFVDRVINRTPQDCLIFWGDWSKRDGFRYQPPVPGVRLRKLFRKAGFHVLLVDEYRTSQTCSFCGNRPLMPCRRYQNPRHPDRGLTNAYGLLRCTDCGMFWNRDHNAAINILNVGRCQIAHGIRAPYLRRGAE